MNITTTADNEPTVRSDTDNEPTVRSVAESEPTARSAVALQQAIQCARLAEDNKGKDVVILDMRGVTPLYDYFILATGVSRRQIHAITEDVDAYLHSEGERRLSIQGYEANKWVVQDYGDIVMHVFNEETRAYYGLEDLWADAKRVDWQRA